MFCALDEEKGPAAAGDWVAGGSEKECLGCKKAGESAAAVAWRKFCLLLPATNRERHWSYSRICIARGKSEVSISLIKINIDCHRNTCVASINFNVHSGHLGFPRSWVCRIFALPLEWT